VVVALGRDRVLQQTGKKAKDYRQTVNSVWIHPPVDDAEALLTAARYQVAGPDLA
jgi:NADH dehydrogenase